MFTTPPSRIILQHLVDIGLAAYPPAPFGQWTGFASGSLPIDTDDVVVLTDISGLKRGRDMLTGDRDVPPRLQVTVRGHDYDEAWAEVVKIADYLSTIGAPAAEWQVIPVTTDWQSGSPEQYLIQSVTVLTEPNFVGQERDTRRQTFGMSLQLNLMRLTDAAGALE